MLIYTGTKQTFNNDVKNNLIATKIRDSFLEHSLSNNSQGEFRAWENSLRCMSLVLDDEIDDECHVAIEYKIPATSKRVDFIITGKDHNDNPNAVIIELKQWNKASKTDREDLVSTFVGGNIRVVTHPSYQAYSYAQTIKNFNALLEDDSVGLIPCAFLHNYEEEHRQEIDNETYKEIISYSPLFLKDDFSKLRNFIKKYIKKADQGEILYKIDNGKIRPSKALQDSLASMLNGNQEFLMIDEQKVVYSTILKIFKDVINTDNKCTIIVKGGPGTGKSVVAINLLVALKEYNTNYVTKNSTPRNIYFEKLRQGNFKQKYIKNLFKGSGCYYETDFNTFDCLIVDEAHRLNKKSAIFHGENQVKEIINASKVSIFFIDEAQIVTTKDIGRVEEIKLWAEQLNSKVYEGEDFILSSQFRCNGSDGYLAFLDNLLGIKKTANIYLEGLDFDLRVYDNPINMRDDLRKLNEKNNKARMVAGYCYEWNSKGLNNEEIYDIVLSHGFKAKWNFATRSTWAIDKDSFDEVGCVHTSQGIEFDYVGVIVGNDLRYEDNRVITDQRKVAKSDKTSGARGTKNLELADQIIRNTYRVLMSRGQKGCFVYCEDKALANYIENIVNKVGID